MLIDILRLMAGEQYTEIGKIRTPIGLVNEMFKTAHADPTGNYVYYDSARGDEHIYGINNIGNIVEVVRADDARQRKYGQIKAQHGEAVVIAMAKLTNSQGP